MKYRKHEAAYEAPSVNVLALVFEGCVASSANDTLQDMIENEIYDEEF